MITFYVFKNSFVDTNLFKIACTIAIELFGCQLQSVTLFINFMQSPVMPGFQAVDLFCTLAKLSSKKTEHAVDQLPEGLKLLGYPRHRMLGRTCTLNLCYQFTYLPNEAVFSRLFCADVISTNLFICLFIYSSQ